MWRTWLALLSIGSAGMVERPLCEMRSPNTPVAGFLSQGNLVLDAGCRYRLFEKSNAASCLKGNWIAVTGSSNALLQFNNLVNFLAPGEYFVDRTGELIGVSAVVDVVIVDGKVTHWDTVSNHAHPCRQVDLKEEAKRWPECRQLIQDMFGKVPAHDSQSIRLTFFTSFFWKRTELALQLIEEDTVWKMANFGLVTQIGAWYKNCCFMKFQYCPRKELLAYDIFAEGGELFKAELEESLGRLQSFCGPGGRAQLGCNVQTISYTNGPRDKKVFKHLNQFILQAMEKLKSPQFRLVDFFALGQGMPEEVYGDHASQMLNIWGWIVQLNTFCPEHTASSAPYATWDGTMCTGMEARYQKCPKYFQKCSIGHTCEKWECMNSVPCTFRARNEAPLFFGKSPGLCDKPVNVSSFLAPASGDRCHRIWCSDQLYWALAAFTVLLAIGLKYWLSEKVESKKVELVDLKRQESHREFQCQAGEGDGDRDRGDRDQTAPLLELPSDAPGSPSKSKPNSSLSFFGRKRGDAGTTAVAPEIPTESKATSGTSTSGGDGAIRRSSKTTMVNSAEAPMNSSKDDIQNSTPEVEIRVASDSVETNSLKSESKEIDLPAAGDKYPLGLARFLASSHVVLGHLFARGVAAPIYFFHWGFTWVPWFFMLSGFVLFSAFLKGPKEETMVQYVLRRSTTIYPLYAFALLLAFIIGKIRGNIYTEWPTLLAQSFLVQSWVPFFTENALQMHCWFLSCLVVYWFFFKPISLRLRDLTLKQTCQLMGFFFALPWLIILIPAMLHDHEDWYKEHDFYETDTFLDFGVVMLKYHPFCYFHVFLLGMLLAKLRQLLDQHARACKEGCFSWRNPYVIVLQFVAPCGYLALLLIFTIQTFHAKAWGYKLAARVSVLLPFQAMILFGLAGLPSLPLPFFSYGFSKMDFLEKYSYTVYIFQFLLYGFWPQVGQVNLPVFLIFLYSSSYIITNCIQQPIQKWWASHQTGQLVVPVALAAFFMVCCAIPDLQIAPVPDLPALVQLDRSIDVRLKFHDPEGHPDSSIINPSVLVKDDEIIVVARRHRRERTQHSGVYDGPDGSWDAVIIEEIWHSDIVMGRAAASAWSWDGVKPVNPVPEVTVRTWGGLLTEDGGAWEDLCVVETWIPENRTLMRMIVTGPEDPKVVELEDGKDGKDGILLAFDSRPPKGPSSCRRNTQGRLESVPQMYVASSIDVSKPLLPIKGYRLKSGSSDLAEKNWIPFVYESSLHFVYTPLPHYILGADLDGSSSSDTIYSTTHGPFHQLQKEHLEIRGSAQAVLVNNPKSTPHLPHPHYLALIHLFDPTTHRYGHFAYRFQAEPPFMILQVSSQLPLSEAAATPNGVAFAFASGLAVKGNTVLVTYGAGDREARALVMTMEKLDELFQCGSAPATDSK